MECPHRMSINIPVIVRKVVFHKEKHEFHNGYPSAPNEIEIKNEMLSNYQLSIKDC